MDNFLVFLLNLRFLSKTFIFQTQYDFLSTNPPKNQFPPYSKKLYSRYLWANFGSNYTTLIFSLFDTHIARKLN